MQQTSSAPKFPQAGWLGVHIATLSRKTIRRIMGKPKASHEQMEALREKFGGSAHKSKR